MNAMATKLDLADAQFIGYSHGRSESLLDMVASIGLTENEWEKWKKDYPTNCLRQQEIDEINDYFFKMKKFELEHRYVITTTRDKNNNCTLCGRPVGNTVFTVCDGCWDKKEQE